MSGSLRYRGPYHWGVMLDFFGNRAIDAVERCGALSYRRTFEAGGRTGIVSIAADPTSDSVEVHVRSDNPDAARGVDSRVRAMLDLDADMKDIESRLRAAPLPSPLAQQMAGVRVPGAWDPFELGVRAILGQQITVKAARTLAGRLCHRFGRRVERKGIDSEEPWRAFPTPDSLAEADIGVIGIPRRRAETVRAFARVVADQHIVFHADSDLDELERQLLALPGIGKWTVGYMRMRAFKDPDAFPQGDVALVKAANLLGIASDAAQLERASQRWRPWRAYVAVRLWHSLSGARDTPRSRR